MRGFRSLLIDKVDIWTPNLQILTLAVHRHLPELTAVVQHRHPYSQTLLFLGGHGWQTLSRDKIRIEPGALVMIPRGVQHTFVRAGNKAPLCLAIDFRMRDVQRQKATVSSLSRSEMAQVRQSLAHLKWLQAGTDGSLRCESAALVLQTMIALLRSAGWLARELPKKSGHRSRAISSLLDKMELTTPLGDVIRRSGYQRDHLNFLVKRETGLALGQLRTQRRLASAKRMLSDGMQVAEAGAAVGMMDQSYFARWFRRQTGQSPSAWSRSAILAKK